MKFGIIGSGSWGTALAKILTDNSHSIYFWNRSEDAIAQFKERRHNPQYLQSARFDMEKLTLTSSAQEVVDNCDCIVIAIPSSFAVSVLETLDKSSLKTKKIISAIKGILPDKVILLNDYLKVAFDLPIENYFTVLGPCHAEEVAQEKLSYLTFSGLDSEVVDEIAAAFTTPYLNTITNSDIYGVQYAAVLKNIYAVGSGIAHGLDYGDNFLSVLIANAADEMAGFLRKAGIINAEVGYIDEERLIKAHLPLPSKHHQNYAASVYLGDLLVTCYSLHSRNRAFGNMVGKGYSVKAAQMEMSMVAEGYIASRCMNDINEKVKANMPIAKAIYSILWEGASAKTSFKELEGKLI